LALLRVPKHFGRRAELLAEPDFLGHVALVATIVQGEGLQRIVGDSLYVVGR